MFEILSNSIDEAREGYGDTIVVTRYRDHSIEVEDFGRGIPVDYNQAEDRYNWELVFCELYAGGKYNTNEAESYEFSLCLNGWTLATQYSSEYMDVEIWRDCSLYTLRSNGEKMLAPAQEESRRKKTAQNPVEAIWRFSDINIRGILPVCHHGQAVSQAVHPVFPAQRDAEWFGSPLLFENGITDYVKEIAGKTCSPRCSTGRPSAAAATGGRRNTCKAVVAMCFQRVKLPDYYTNQPLKTRRCRSGAVKSRCGEIDSYLKQSGK
jgi:DNA gyrase subunit B